MYRVNFFFEVEGYVDIDGNSKKHCAALAQELLDDTIFAIETPSNHKIKLGYCDVEVGEVVDEDDVCATCWNNWFDRPCDDGDDE